MSKEPIILLVEDDRDTARMLAYVFKSLGFKRLLEAEDGEAALVQLRTKGVSCIVSDWHMPRMSGIELFNHVKEDDLLKRIPFLMLTTEAHKENVEEAVASGVTDYILKPFTSNIIETKMRSILGSRFPVHK